MNLFAKGVGTTIQIESHFIKQGSIEVPVLTDVHSNLEGLYHAISQLQLRRQRIFPVVLVTGDLGFFPDPSRLDEKTRIRELSDRHEQSLPLYFKNQDLYYKYYSGLQRFRALQAKIYFVRGNHEDHKLLEEFANRFPRQIVKVDLNGVLHFLTDGSLINLQVEGFNSPVVMAAFGGISKDSRPKAYEREHRIGFNYKSMDQLLEAISKSNRKVDLLLTHQSIQQFVSGNSEINTLVELINPHIHLSGHGHQRLGPVRVGNCSSYQIKKLDTVPRPDPSDGCCLILEIKPEGTLSVVEKP